MILLVFAGVAPGERRASAQRRHREHRALPASRIAAVPRLGRPLSGRPGPDRRRQFPLAGRRRHPARNGVRDRAEHGRQHAHADHRGRVARADPARVVGHDAARRRARPDDRLPRHRADVDLGLRAGRHQPPQRAFGRGRAEVLPARRVLDGVPAVRHRARLRRDGHDEPDADRRPHRRLSVSDRARCSSPASRCC